MKIIVNKVRCKICGSVIESKHVHDYQRASWPAGADVNDYIDFSYSKYKK
jgi:hypothetical protein